MSKHIKQKNGHENFNLHFSGCGALNHYLYCSVFFDKGVFLDIA